MLINCLLLSSLFFLFLCLEADFELKYKNWDEKNIIESLRKTYLEVEASFGSNMDNFTLILDTDSQATLIPGVEHQGTVKRFDKSQSSTFKEIKYIPNQYNNEKFYKGLLGADNFKLGNSQKINNISFIVGEGFTLEAFGTYAFLGLKREVNASENNYNIIKQMKEKDVISNPIWFLNFESDTKGKFIIGTFPENNYKDTYSEEDRLNLDIYEHWQLYVLKFEDIYYGKIENYDKKQSVDPKHTISKFNINTRLFLCTPDFGAILHDSFFKQKKGICEQGTLEDKYIYYYCKKDKFNMSEMENVNFEVNNQKGNMTLVFEPKDLFYEHGDYYYFLMIYKPDDYITPSDTEWVIPTLFIKKYITTFNRNDRLIYFYSKTIDKNNNNNGGDGEGGNDDKTKYIIIISVLSIIFLGCIGFLIFYIIKIKPRKKKANELDDVFEYKANQNEEGGDSALINE